MDWLWLWIALYILFGTMIGALYAYTHSAESIYDSPVFVGALLSVLGPLGLVFLVIDYAHTRGRQTRQRLEALEREIKIQEITVERLLRRAGVL